MSKNLKLDAAMSLIGIVCAVGIAGIAAPMAAQGYEPHLALAVDILITSTGVAGLLIFSRSLLHAVTVQ